MTQDRTEQIITNLSEAIDQDNGHPSDVIVGTFAEIQDTAEENAVGSGRSFFDLPDEVYEDDGDAGVTPVADAKTKMPRYKSGGAKVLFIGGILTIGAGGVAHLVTSGTGGSVPAEVATTSESPRAEAAGGNSEEVAELTRRLAISNQGDLDKAIRPRPSDSSASPSPSGSPSTSPTATQPPQGQKSTPTVTVLSPKAVSQKVQVPTVVPVETATAQAAIRPRKISNRTRRDRTSTGQSLDAGRLARIEQQLARLESRAVTPRIQRVVDISQPRRRTQAVTPVQPVVAAVQPVRRTRAVTPVQPVETAVQPVRRTRAVTPVQPVVAAVQPVRRTRAVTPTQPVVAAVQPVRRTRVVTPAQPVVAAVPPVTRAITPEQPVATRTTEPSASPYRVDLPRDADVASGSTPPAPAPVPNEQVTSDQDTLVMGVRPVAQVAQSSGDLPSGVPLTKANGTAAKIGQFISAKTATPLRAIAANTSGGNGGAAATGTIAIQITSPMYGSGGETLLPSGTNLVAGITVADNGLVQVTGLKAVVNGQEVVIPADSIQIETDQRQPVVAERKQIGTEVIAGNDRTNAILGGLATVGQSLNRQETSTLVSQGAVIQNTGGPPNVFGAALEGAGNQLITGAATRNNRESQRLDAASPIWTLPTGVNLNVIVVKPFSL
jgi:hypothetical protein